MYLLHEFAGEPLLVGLPADCISVNVRTETLPEGVAYPPLLPGTLPVVIIEAPAYSAEVPQYEASGAFMGMARVTVPAGQEIIRNPASWAAVDSYVAYVTARAAANPPG